MVTKPYLKMPIAESGEPLVPIPTDCFAYASPHAYEALGAPYGETSPYFLRQGVLEALHQAQSNLQVHHPHWQIYIFDAYRPIAVQDFMVNHAFQELLLQENLSPNDLTPDQAEHFWQQVYQIWALPSEDPRTPPPHSTGAAVDVTLYNHTHKTLVFMGSPIDELSARSQPDYFARVAADPHTPPDVRAEAQLAAQNRKILSNAMLKAGFQRHPGEWWHFCLGDQMWAWLTQQAQPNHSVTARYGGVTPS